MYRFKSLKSMDLQDKSREIAYWRVTYHNTQAIHLLQPGYYWDSKAQVTYPDYSHWMHCGWLLADLGRMVAPRPLKITTTLAHGTAPGCVVAWTLLTPKERRVRCVVRYTGHYTDGYRSPCPMQEAIMDAWLITFRAQLRYSEQNGSLGQYKNA